MREARQTHGVKGMESRRRLIAGGLSAAPVLLAMHSKSALATSTCLSPSRTMSGNMSAAQQAAGCAQGQNLNAWAQTTNWPTDIKPTLEICTRGRTQNANNCNGPSVSLWGAFAFPSPPPGLPDFSFVGYQCSSHAGQVTVSGGPVAGVTKRVVSGGFGPLLATILGDDRGIPAVVPSYANDLTAPTVAVRAVSVWEVIAYHSAIKGLYSGATTVDLARYCIVAYYNALSNPTYPVSAAQVKEMWLGGTSGSGYCALASCTAPWYQQDIIDYLKSIGV